MSRKIMSKGGYEWVRVRADSNLALKLALRPPETTAETEVANLVAIAAEALAKAVEIIGKELAL